MKLIDNHCHLDFPQFDGEREEVIEKCEEDLELVVNSGSDITTNKSTLELSEKHRGFIYPTVGLHPTKIEEKNEEDLEEVLKMIRENSDKIVAVGEIGMDFFHEKTDKGREKQENFFRKLLELAEEIGKPVVVHSRDAEKQVLEILEEYDLRSVIMHCFNGSKELVDKAVNKGYFISVTTQVLYSKRVREIVETAPIDKILLETDAPYLYPGKEKNYPYNVHESLKKIASILGASKEEIGEQFNKNTREAYLGVF